jgi:hypothetical protein
MIWAPLLLADPSPNLRLLVLCELLGRSTDDQEVRELEGVRELDPIIQDLLALQETDGSWRATGAEKDSWHKIYPTSQALLRLGFLGFGPEHRAVQRGAEHLFRHQLQDGSWPLPGSKEERELGDGYSMIPLQTAMPLRALAAVGYASDGRTELAYEWLLDRRLPEGAWPSGIAGGVQVFPGGYRRLAHSRYGCRTNTSLAVSALALHPVQCTGAAARRGLDLLLAHETQQASNLGFEVARTIGAERARGFFTYFARYDVAFILDLCWRIGASVEDARVADMAGFVRELQGPYGLWEYASHPEVSRWVSFDLARSLSRLDKQSDWVSLEPRTPFRPYPKRPRRY